MEAFTHEEIEAIINENAITVRNSENIDDIIDSDSDTYTERTSEYESVLASSYNTDDEDIINNPDIFFMPNVDLDVCPIEELKFFEFTSLYARELIEHDISDEEVMEFISWFSEAELLTNRINDLFLDIISIL
jgi:hypothetical protein